MYEEIIDKFNRAGFFKKCKKNTKDNAKIVIRCLLNFKGKVYLKAKDISNQTGIDIRNINNVLKRMKKLNLLEVRGINRKFIVGKECLENKYAFPGKMDDLINENIGNLISDSNSNLEIKRIIIEETNIYLTLNKINNIEKLEENCDEKSLFGIFIYLELNKKKLYEIILEKIEKSGLYSKEKSYGKIEWRNMAHKYMLKI